MGESLFRSFHRENRNLTEYLDQRFLRPLHFEINQLDEQTLTSATPAELALALVAARRVDPPTLGGTEQARVVEHDGSWRLVDPAKSIRVSTTRFYIAIQIKGDHELLDWWPNEEDNGNLTPIDELPAAPPTDPVRQHLTQHRHEQWHVAFRSGDSGEVALYTFVELTTDEVQDVRNSKLSPKGIVDEERKHIEPIVAAVARQTKQFFDETLPELAQQAIESRIQWLRALQAVSADLTWPDGFKFTPPEVETSLGVNTTEEQAAAEGLDLAIAFRDRLASATFDDMMRTVRIWGSAVERYPSAYTELQEERLSDLLAATLNAALPGAQREVYTRGGKSDIFVHADAIDNGRSHARVFIGECKWWDGPKTITAAYQQLWEYLEVKDTFGMLLMFSRRVDFKNVRAAAYAAMIGLSETTETNRSPVEGWPYLAVARDGRNVTLCVATLDLPPPK